MSADFVVVSPQAPAAAGATWSDKEGVAIGALEDLAAAISEALAVDPARVYLTGLSMGGAGTWCDPQCSIDAVSVLFAAARCD